MKPRLILTLAYAISEMEWKWVGSPPMWTTCQGHLSGCLTLDQVTSLTHCLLTCKVEKARMLSRLEWENPSEAPDKWWIPLEMNCGDGRNGGDLCLPQMITSSKEGCSNLVKESENPWSISTKAYTFSTCNFWIFNSLGTWISNFPFTPSLPPSCLCSLPEPTAHFCLPMTYPPHIHSMPVYWDQCQKPYSKEILR